MTPEDLKGAQKRLGMTQAQLANILEISQRTIRRYANGTWKIPRGIEYAINWLLHVHDILVEKEPRPRAGKD